MKLGLLQIRVEAGDRSGNFERATTAIREAAVRETDLLVLPELWNVGYFDFDAYETAAEGLNGPTLSRISDLAQEYRVSILAGSIVEDLTATEAATPATTGLSNTSVFFDSSGTRQLIYRKHHLFGYQSEESRLLTPGERLETTTIGGFTVGVTTCYDLRFPELYRELVDRGVTLILVPSAWPYPRIEHWTTLTRARAIENQLYVVGVNGSGPAGGPGLIGRSRVIDPWGTTVRAVGSDPETAITAVEPETVDAVRERFPTLDDRRP
ncbi:MAG: carbon-nitrogen family hydrolase [Halodesulfurarchaeum sp.]|nr:carbon-nitrogen family hydrolase [Halodesulfurarchaeum sp.]